MAGAGQYRQRQRSRRDVRPGANVRHVLGLLAAAGLGRDESIEVLGNALAELAVTPYWTDAAGATDAHAALAENEPEVAAAVEALAPWLLGRVDQHEAVSAVQDLLRKDA